MIIEKTARDFTKYRRELRFFSSARRALSEILHRLHQKQSYTLLLPGYIGYSPNEGSGIYDPVRQEGIPYIFYPVNRELQIEVKQLEQYLSQTPGQKVVLLVHYFGYPDYQLGEIVSLCRRYGAVIIEDAAHAFFTDFVDHACGNFGDFTIYSLHKMFPFEDGGMLKINSNLLSFDDNQTPALNPFDYDLYAIAEARKANARRWEELLEGCADEITILHKGVEDVTPQTFPVIVKNYDRTQLYFKLNESGFGAVSLYHTMIEPIRNGSFQDALWLSKHIINLPTHQDAECSSIDEMCSILIRTVQARK